MNEQPCKPALRIAAKIAEQNGCDAQTQHAIARLVHEEIKDCRPLDAYAQSLKDILYRIIFAEDPHFEVLKIANAIGVPISFK